MLKNLERWHKHLQRVALVCNGAIMQRSIGRSNLERCAENLERIAAEMRKMVTDARRNART